MAVRYETEQPVLTPAVSQMSMLPTIDREGITKFINEQGYLTYIVRAVKINSYLKSLMSLAGLLSQFNICITESREAKGQALEKTKAHVDDAVHLHVAGMSRKRTEGKCGSNRSESLAHGGISF